jgi:predicted PurR-regulated permease PerM
MNQSNSNEGSIGSNGGWSRTRFRAIASALFLAVGIYLCYRLAQPCIPSLVWAGALALIFAPFQRWMEAKVRHPNLAAALSLAIIAVLVVAPATWFAHQLAQQATSVPQSIQKQIAAGKWHAAADENSQAGKLAALVEQQARLPENTSLATTWLKATISRIIQQSALAALQVCLTLYFLFYFLRDRVRVLDSIRSFLPLSESDTNILFCRVNETIHATLYGMLVLSALQGVLGGLMYWWLGIPTPCFWAVVMGALAFVPVVDTLVIWVPAAGYLALEGRWGEAVGFAGLGSLVIRAIENLLYPVLVKDRLRIPSVSIFIALLGGILFFGWTGLVLGPVIFTLTNALLDICAEHFGEPRVLLFGSRAEPDQRVN